MSGDLQGGGWPTAELDDVRRLRVMAAAIPGGRVSERVLPLPLDEVWAVMGDLEDGFGRFQTDMRHVRVVRAEGGRVVAVARSRFGMRARLEGTLRPGWCWLQSRFLILGMAAAPEPGGGTRVAVTGGVRVPARAAIIPLGVRRELDRTLARLADELR
ncbi:hypothetical protein [Actinomadura rupiterrae]|uniref:hypothetical protein n=1 Tax=Actinomadura rupiterrae TaxID=559627 RepID=UPI0020A60AEF|nr:hypothetical protein [Actinomadura rupiterrae]MCP2340209.1 hypothetical protein [Actinomadura rupiterrae]